MSGATRKREPLSGPRREHLRRIGQQAGQPGRNPYGVKGKDGLSRAALFREVGDEETMIDDGAAGVRMSKVRAIVVKVFDAAAAGDMRAAALVLDGCFGKLKETVELEEPELEKYAPIVIVTDRDSAQKLSAQGQSVVQAVVTDEPKKRAE